MPFELMPSEKLFRLARSPFSFPDIFQDFEKQMGLINEQTGLELSEDKKSIYVKASMPGLKLDQIEVSLEKGMLQIKGEKQEEEKDEGVTDRKYYRRAQRSFWYQVALPAQVDDGQEPKALYKNGVLELTLTKAKLAQSKKITVKNGDKS